MKAFEERLAGVAMLGVMLLGGWQALAALQHSALKDVPTSSADIRSGVSSDKFSHFLDDHLPWRPDLIAWANAGRYVLVRGAGDQVRLGYDEWLFSVEEIEYFRQASEFQQVRTGVIGQLSSALARQNVRLVVAVVPDKARIHAQQFMGHRYPEWYQDRYASILQQLKAHQVMVVDVQQAMRLELAARPDQSLYYRTDTHWNQTGARLAAQAVSQVVRQQGLKGESVVFQTETDDKTTVRVGDLLRMMGLGDMPDLFRPNPDTEHTDTTRKLAGNASMGLLGDIQVPVTLVGTSYSLRANFQGYLQASLQADVLNVAQDGGGFMQSMASYLKDDAFKSSPPQVLVWEVPERVFSRPLAVNESQPPGF